MEKNLFEQISLVKSLEQTKCENVSELISKEIPLQIIRDIRHLRK